MAVLNPVCSHKDAANGDNVVNTSGTEYAHCGIHTFVWTWGGGRNGELGHTNIDKEGVCAYPTKVKTLENTAVAQVSCGEACMAIVTTDGRLYTCGSGRGGKLGHASKDTKNGETCSVPQLVGALQTLRVTQVSVGESHMACVTEPGDQSGFTQLSLTIVGGFAWSWGKGTNGCLGSGSSTDRDKPGPIVITMGGPQLQFSCLCHRI